MDFLSVASKPEALEQIGRFGGDATIMAGGTYVMAQVARHELAPGVVIHLERAEDLCGIEASARPVIGALVTPRMLATASAIQPYEALRLAASACGGWQTQSVATLGGNICNASPAADLVPPLMAHGARVTLDSARGGSRTISLVDFILGPGQTARQPDELLVSVDLDPLPPCTADTFVKVGCRGAMDVAVVSLAMRLMLSGDGRVIDDIRIAVGAMGPTPFRATEAEMLLKGHPISEDAIRAAASAVLQRAAPLSDLRGSADYRRAVLPRVFDRALRHVASAAAARLN